MVLWDFYRSVFLEFTCDEMSQFIFWATKVRLLCVYCVFTVCLPSP